MNLRARLVVAAGGTALLFVLVQVGALLLVEPFTTAGYQAVEDPTDPVNSLVYLGAILVMTGFILVVIRLGVESVLRATVLLMSAVLAWYVFSVTVPMVLGPTTSAPVAAGLAAALGLALWIYPEWYVIDAAGVVIAAGGAGLFGISFGPLPAILLLGALAVYDAVAVYRTKHMLTLAESVTGLKLPLVLVIPLSRGYSFLDDGAVGGPPGDDADAHVGPNPTEESISGGADRDGPSDPDVGAGDADEAGLAEREAFFIGLGDTVMPTILVASAAVFLDTPGIVGLGAVNLPALTAMVGTLLGLAVLLFQVAKGQAHAGLPLLNGGAIVGYLLGAVAAGVPLIDALGLAPYL